MQDFNFLDWIPKEWTFINLPGYRDFPAGELKNYHTFAFAELPLIREELQGNYNWLKDRPTYPHSIGYIDYIASGYSVLEGEPQTKDFLENDVHELLENMQKMKEELPKEFISFLLNKNLPRKIRSSTHCNLSLSVRPALVESEIEGIVLTFLTDSQGSPNWSLLIGKDPKINFVICSSRRFGFDSYDAKNWANELEDEIVDLRKEKISICAYSFEEFIYRFWIENEIWFSKKDNQKLEDKNMLLYAAHYLNQT